MGLWTVILKTKIVVSGCADILVGNCRLESRRTRDYKPVGEHTRNEVE
jgi:hypothetical protein